MHQTIVETIDSHDFKLLDPTSRDTPMCDGLLLRNMDDKYTFTVRLSNYTKR